jgi:cold shock CspA family protein
MHDYVVNTTRVTGTVKIINFDLCYYIIRQDAPGPDVFCHCDMLPSDMELKINQRVSFMTMRHPKKGLRAVNLEIC